MLELLQLFIVVVVFILDRIAPITSASSYSCSYNFQSCSKGETIAYPFYWADPDSEYYCGYQGLSAECSKEGRPVLTLSNHSYYYQPTVFRIGFSAKIQVLDIDIDDQLCPHPRKNFSLEGAVASSLHIDGVVTDLAYFYNCTTLPKVVAPNLPCVDNNSINASGLSFAAIVDNIPKGFNWYGNCKESVTIPIQLFPGKATNYAEAIKSGIELVLQPSEYCQSCEKSGGFCMHKRNSNASSCLCQEVMIFDNICPPYSTKDNVTTLTSEYCQKCKISGGSYSYNKSSNSSSCACDAMLFNKICPHSYKDGAKHVKIILILCLLAGTGATLLILLIVYRRDCLKIGPTNEELFLKSHGSHFLQRYKYSDVKKMTNSFKDRLGKGGFGSVFKGKLSDGRMVAVKLLNESKGDGDEFINEVATISRTNHVNIVTLIGFCIEGTKRALVYEFMVNGSLEKFIYTENSSAATYAPALGWDKLYQIELGIARGLEYLHRGCNNRILHFDIKPHNILLDSKFVPKISDFGLAKLSQTKDSFVSMVGTRGTNGYIAPEIYCRNLGVVSYKSDVYSYGMMLFEMIGGRKNIDTSVENISEIYFPHWIYNHLNKEKKIDVSEYTHIDVSEDILEDDIARKMIIVALWCIQAHPVDRPSMKKVAEMLEESNDKLQMPPNPSLGNFPGLLSSPP